MRGGAWWRRSLRARLVAGSTAVLVAGVATADVTAYVALRNHLTDRTTDSLEIAAGRIRAAPTGRQISLGPNVIQSLVPAGLFVALLDEDGRVLLTSAPSGSGSAPADLVTDGLDRYPADELLRREADGRDFLLLRVDAPAGSLVTAGKDPSDRVAHVVLGADLEPSEDATSALLRTELLVGLVILAVWAAAAWTVIGVGLRPLRAMARAAHQIAIRSEGRLPEGHPASETGALASALNEAFEVRSRAEAKARTFLADASHELRTPLASIRAWTELYRVGGAAAVGKVDEAMAAMDTDARRMSQVVEQMLELARLDAVAAGPPRPVDLVTVARQVVDELHLLGEGRLTLDVPAAGLWVDGDRDELRSMTQNLVRNALIHAGDAAHVDVSVSEHDSRAVLVVADDGPGLTSAEIAKAFDRFWRADDARGRPGGSGLGLAIAQEVARRAGGDLVLSRRRPTGLVAAATFPLTAPPSGDVQDQVSTPGA